MSQVTKVMSFIAVLFVGVATVTPWPTEAASPSKADKGALKRAIVACKAEAKGRKINGSRAANTSTIASRRP
jgi:hypothetical protein